MRARRCVHTAIREPQPGNRLATDQVTVDDLVDVRLGNASVPHGVGVDDHRRSVLALIEAARLVGTDAALQPTLGERLLEGLLKRVAGIRVTAAARVSRRPLVGADEEVSFEGRHGDRTGF
jgi:hypothetical protein